MENQKENKVWFITGSSRGFGRIWTEAILERGDKVVATARKLSSIAELNDKYGESVLTLELDVTKPEQVKTTITEAQEHFGRLDVILNNAGYSLVGTIEEAQLDDVRALYETNIFGSLSVIQAALPLLRKQGSGHIIGVSSSLGHESMPVIGYYCSSKWAYEAIYESLAKEVESFGIKVSLIEPGAYATEFGSPESLKMSQGLDIYTEFKQQFALGLRNMERGNPNATPPAIFKLADADQPPLRLLLGDQTLPSIRKAYNERLTTWEDWKEVSIAAQS